MRLADLFASFAEDWPDDVINTSFPYTNDAAGVAGALAGAIEVEDVATEVGPDGTVTVTGRLTLIEGLPPARVRLVSHLFPELGFVFAPTATWSSDFRVSKALAAGGSTVQIDTLPLEVRVPIGLLSAHPDPERRGSDSGITLAYGDPESVIEREFSFLLDAAGQVHLEPHVPISIGACRFFGVPVNAVHELTLISAPDAARAQVDWIVRDLATDPIPFGGGALGFGGIELDFAHYQGPLHDLKSRLRLSDEAQLVLEDIVLPSVLAPIPLHGSLGLRRRLDLGENLSDFLTFAGAPLVVPVGRDADLFLSKLFFRTPAQEEDWWSGLTLEGGVSWPGAGGDFEVEIGLVDGDVLRVSFAHTPPPVGDDIPVIRLDLWKYIVDIFRVRLGVSLQELGEDSPSPGAAIQGLVDIIIREKPGETPGAAGAVKVETEDGRPFEAALTDIGWDRGKPSGNMVMPRGARLRLHIFVLEFHEMGLAYENGATYFSLSGGVRVDVAPFEGAVWFMRLRGKLGGNPAAPAFQLGGFGFAIKIEEVVEITAHGNFRDELLPDGTRVQEQGLGGGIVIFAGGNKWGLTLDVFWGTRTPAGGDAQEYFLFLIALFGMIPMGPVELRGIEALYATGLMPKLDEGDRQAGELKYYKWLNRARPTALPETRGMDAWKPTQDAWAFGLGVGISMTGCGSVFQLKAFGAGFDAPTAAGLIIVVEFGLFEAKKPLAIGAFEYDFKTDAFVLMIQLDVSLSDFIDNFPKELAVRLGGTITIGNKPGLIALGRLNDQDTWIGGKLELDLADIFVLKLRAAICFEWQEDAHVGGGLALSITVTSTIGVMALQGWGVLEVLMRYMLSGTNDFVARLRFEAGFTIILFGFLRFGISVELLAEWLAHVPNYFVFRFTLRLETPWFLPDFSLTAEHVSGELKPAERGVTTSALMQAGAHALTGVKAARVRRADSRQGGAPTELVSVDDLAGRIGVWQGEAQPIPLDASVEINFSMMVVDALGIGQVNPDFGVQVAGDGELALSTRYTLVGLSMRRRPLGGGAWMVAETLADAASPRNFRWSWHEDVRTRGQVAPKTLLLNGRAPFTVGIDNPIADAEILEDNPSYPCCQVRRPDVARFDFTPEPVGSLPAGFVRTFRYEDRGAPAPVRVRGNACAVGPPQASGATASRVGSFAPTGEPVATVSASEDLAAAVVRVAVDGKQKAQLIVVTVDADGNEVARAQKSTGATAFQDIPINPGRPFRTILLVIESLGREPGDTTIPATVVLDAMECVTQADKDRFERESDRCERVSSEGHAQPVTLLARHEYEIDLTTMVEVRHSATEWQSATITETVGFVTAGPPGLNESPEPGLELEPYVVTHAPGGRGLTYREESVHLVLSDALRIFGPGAGTGETGFRLPVTIAVESSFDNNPEAHQGKSSRASADWFLTHRGEPDPWVSGAVLDVVAAHSRDGRAGRYQVLNESSDGTCPPDDVWTEKQPRVGVDPFDPSGRSLWEPLAAYVAVLRLAGSPVVDRDPFVAADITSFSAVTGAWTFAEGALRATATTTGRFGDTTWDLYRADVRGEVAPGGELGIVVLADPARPAQGIRARIRRGNDANGTLVVDTAAGVPIESMPLTGMDDRTALAVEAFADSVRCRVGQAVISVPRGTRGTGGCVLLATQASVTALTVHGLDMYRQPFRTSRYEGFAEHLASCSGVEHYDTGPAAESLAGVRARFGGAIAAAMTPTASPADRESQFADVTSALAVPLREDPDRVHLTCFASPSDRWLLLESPEPMDFAEEIALGLARKVAHPGVPLAERARLAALIEAALQNPMPPRPTIPSRPGGVRTLVVPDGRPGILDQPGSRRPAYSARLEGKFLVVTDLRTRDEAQVRAPALSREDRAMLADVTVDLNDALRIIRWRTPTTVEWVPTPITMIQNAPATHALLLPGPGHLIGGTYRLTLALTRRWFDTVAPVGTGNAYLDDGVLEFDLP